MEGDDYPMPNALWEGFRFERFGAPYSGGYRQWPYKWLMQVETALNVYHALKEMNWAMSNLEDTERNKALTKWKNENARLVRYVAQIERLVAEQSESDNG